MPLVHHFGSGRKQYLLRVYDFSSLVPSLTWDGGEHADLTPKVARTWFLPDTRGNSPHNSVRCFTSDVVEDIWGTSALKKRASFIGTYLASGRIAPMPLVPTRCIQTSQDESLCILRIFNGIDPQMGPFYNIIVTHCRTLIPSTTSSDDWVPWNEWVKLGAATFPLPVDDSITLSRLRGGSRLVLMRRKYLKSSLASTDALNDMDAENTLYDDIMPPLARVPADWVMDVLDFSPIRVRRHQLGFNDSAPDQTTVGPTDPGARVTVSLVADEFTASQLHGQGSECHFVATLPYVRTSITIKSLGEISSTDDGYINGLEVDPGRILVDLVGPVLSHDGARHPSLIFFNYKKQTR